MASALDAFRVLCRDTWFDKRFSIDDRIELNKLDNLLPWTMLQRPKRSIHSTRSSLKVMCVTSENFGPIKVYLLVTKTAYYN